MNARELRKAIQKIPDDYPVRFATPYGGCEEISVVTVDELSDGTPFLLFDKELNFLR